MDKTTSAQAVGPLPFGSIDTTNVMEQFDFDAFLESGDGSVEAVPKAVSLDPFRTISEDLADGKLAQKDRDLKLLLKTTASSAVGAMPENSGNIHKNAISDLEPSVDFATIEQASPLEDDSVHRDFIHEMEGHSATQPRPNKKRKFEKTKIDAFIKPYLEQVRTIYLITCHSNLYTHHSASAYEDPPFRESRGIFTNELRHEPGHLNGKRPISNLSLYMREGNNDTPVIVVRTVNCADNVHIGFGSDQALNYTESLAIKSLTLRRAIAAVARCYYNKLKDPGFVSSNQQQNQIEQYLISHARPFFFHHSSLLEKYASSHAESAHHIKILLAYCHHRYGQDFAAANQAFQEGLVSQKHLEKLFAPNIPILVKGEGSGNTDEVYVTYHWPRFSSDGSMQLDCWSWQHDGQKFVRRSQTWRMMPISSSNIPIQKLSMYPLQLAPDEVQKTLEARGRKHWSYRHSSHVSYRGWNISHDEFYPGSRFMIDYKVYRKMHEYGPAFKFSEAPSPRSYDNWPKELELDNDPSPSDYMLMPADIYGFYLTEKQWINISVDGVQPIQWNKSAYERLVLPSATKELVRALVTVRTSQRGVKHGLGSTGKRVDIVAGKGNGLIMLLHGGPGTGKSLTAESVAEIAEMPLYRVTCGDIGATPAEVEKYLAAVMYLGTTWNSVLLLDEADVFLEERSMSDLARNSLVSVFLRILEYYDGILILTSNRVGMFDEAFKSRIQVALHYQNLTRPARRKIWNNFIEMLEEDEEDANFHELNLHLDELAAFDLNGRQIRNTLTTARELAMFKAERLDWKHLEQALKVSTDFSDYLRTMQGHTDDQKARDEKIR